MAKVKKKQEEVSKESLRDQIAADTEEFLASGGSIHVVPSGQSGVDYLKPGQKHIKLGNSR